MNRLTVYSRSGCHLCDEMLFVLRQVQPEFGYKLTVEDVDTRQDWQDAHGNRVPVLVANNGKQDSELCWGRINDEAVLNWLNANQS